MRLRGSACVAVLLSAAIGWAQEQPPVVAQEPIGKNACGPCAVVNTLLRAKAPWRALLDRVEGATPPDKARTVAGLFAKKPSGAYGKGEPAYNEKRGMAPADLAASFNELLTELGSKDLLEGSYLDRRAEESLDEHLRRIHGLFAASLKQGMPVLLSVRSFAPEVNARTKEFQWTGLVGHFVAVTEVPETLRSGDKGFPFSFADSYTGKLESGYAFFDEARNFTAAKGDEKNWKWVTDRPFLLVTAPSLRLATQDQAWYLRTTIILNYAIVRRG